MLKEIFTFNELPQAVTMISERLGRIEEFIKTSSTPAPSKEPVRFYTLSEAAAHCKMAEPTFRLYLKSGDVSGCKPGKAWLFTQDDLDKFINRYRIKSKAEVEKEAQIILRRAR